MYIVSGCGRFGERFHFQTANLSITKLFFFTIIIQFLVYAFRIRNAGSVDFPKKKKYFVFVWISPEHLTIYLYGRVIMRNEKYARAKIHKYDFSCAPKNEKKRVYLLIP